MNLATVLGALLGLTIMFVLWRTVDRGTFWFVVFCASAFAKAAESKHALQMETVAVAVMVAGMAIFRMFRLDRIRSSSFKGV